MNDFQNYDKLQVEKTIKTVKQNKEKRLRATATMDNVEPKMKRTLELAQEKGAGAWLSTAPIQSLGFALNKQQFRDSISLRYGWKVPHTPNYCNCKKKKI